MRAISVTDNNEYECELAYDPETQTLTVTPTGRYYQAGGLIKGDAPGFRYGTRIQFTITSNVTDWRGNRLDGQGVGEPSDFTMTFTIEDKPAKSSSSTPFPQLTLIILAVLGGAGICTYLRFR